jgi:nucleoside-diphosphate-sugar epimerase
LKPAAIVHCAAQPSHDLAASRPFDDFDVNAAGTLNVLEAARQACPESPVVHMSTNKVYGAAPNEIPLVELNTRWDYSDPAYPAEWVAEGQSWSEAYLLRAFLSFNEAFEIVFWAPFVARQWADLIREQMPAYMINTGAAI